MFNSSSGTKDNHSDLISSLPSMGGTSSGSSSTPASSSGSSSSQSGNSGSNSSSGSEVVSADDGTPITLGYGKK